MRLHFSVENVDHFWGKREGGGRCKPAGITLRLIFFSLLRF